MALADTVALDIIGDGPERAALEALISELGIEDRVTLLGWCEDARARLESYDLFVLPSRLCLLYTSDAADELLCVDLRGRRIIKKKTTPYILRNLHVTHN